MVITISYVRQPLPLAPMLLEGSLLSFVSQDSLGGSAKTLMFCNCSPARSGSLDFVRLENISCPNPNPNP